MTEKKGLLVATLAAEMPFKSTLCYFPACAIYDSKLYNRFGTQELGSLRSALAARSDNSLAF